MPCTKLGRLVQQVGLYPSQQRRLFHVCRRQWQQLSRNTAVQAHHALGLAAAAASGPNAVFQDTLIWWQLTGMAQLCPQGKIKSLEQIYLFSMPVKEYQIVEFFLGSALKDEVMKIMPVQKQTRAGQRTRFKVGTGVSGAGVRGAQQWMDRHTCVCSSHAGASSWKQQWNESVERAYGACIRLHVLEQRTHMSSVHCPTPAAVMMGSYAVCVSQPRPPLPTARAGLCGCG